MTMRYYPVNLDLKGRPCLVVGGGRVGQRKVRTLLQCGAHITVISPETLPELDTLENQGRIMIRRRVFQANDLDGMFLVIDASNDPDLGGLISAEADARHMLCNVADRPQYCNFILPALIAQGDLTIAISTSGRSPAFAKYLRRRLATQFGPEHAVFLELMGRIRERLLAREHAPEEHKHLFEKLIAGGLLDKIREERWDDINSLLLEVLGEAFGYEDLMST